MQRLAHARVGRNRSAFAFNPNTHVVDYPNPPAARSFHGCRKTWVFAGYKLTGQPRRGEDRAGQSHKPCSIADTYLNFKGLGEVPVSVTGHFTYRCSTSLISASTCRSFTVFAGERDAVFGPLYLFSLLWKMGRLYLFSKPLLSCIAETQSKPTRHIFQRVL